MTTAITVEAEREQQFNAILLGVVRALEKGETPDREKLLARHPEFAAELREFFAGRDCLNRLAARNSGVVNTPGVAGDLGPLGDFRLLREIGRGGMGIVYEARQISLDRCVALKVLPFAASLDPRQLQRFKNEAHAAALLHHPHIVPIYSVGCDQGVHYYAMQFIQGRSLADMIRGLRQPSASATVTQSPRPAAEMTTHIIPAARLASGAPAVPEQTAVTTAAGISTARQNWRPEYFRRVAQMGIDAAEALEHGHQVGVVHRDIKPANLLLDLRGNLWITDFGVALLQRSGSITTTGELVGTLRYMSPEQAAAERGHVDHRTDIYSLGATLYEMLALTAAFPSTEPARLLRQIAHEDPVPPRFIDPAIPVELELIVLKALAKNPAERYATAQELADDLRRYLDDQPIRAKRPSVFDRAVKWSRRHRAVVTAGLAVLVLTAFGLLVSTILISRSHANATAAYEREKKNLAHARQVVAFLTQVAAEEMNDKPEFLPVRQKMLNAALEYYQQFIDEHHADATIRAELDASKTQADHILTVLTVQQEYTQLMLRAILLGESAVQKDLGITPEQREKLIALTAQLKDQNRDAFQVGLKLSEQERGKKFKELAAVNESILTAILTPRQVGRLKQIAVQQHGIYAFIEPDVAAALRLDKDQKLHIRTILDEAKSGRKEIYSQIADPGSADREASLLWKRTEKNLLALLSADQQTTWREMTGERFNSRLDFFPKQGFGPPGGYGPPPPRGDWDNHWDKGPPPDEGRKGKRDGPPPGEGGFPGKKKK